MEKGKKEDVENLGTVEELGNGHQGALGRRFAPGHVVAQRLEQSLEDFALGSQEMILALSISDFPGVG